ncbi:predicted protein [Pyrenophora tritici-repentis Pt-1C-BFP]|uniref:Uncharacterized protein n=1 Tax=Pyrenophora tritici-repentis (strain Pt-1C-BFP) TaxID=426418 RepID=B2VQW9_PYRTR|nr:uncharacterized protein PTRG_00418 [Pyrenophora tritici-repentis Pt-1C-BFP]EDU39856.1 predicted protein [Pyrenophora tritici-repentis Pt-1C-BFP]
MPDAKVGVPKLAYCMLPGHHNRSPQRPARCTDWWRYYLAPCLANQVGAVKGIRELEATSCVGHYVTADGGAQIATARILTLGQQARNPPANFRAVNFAGRTERRPVSRGVQFVFPFVEVARLDPAAWGVEKGLSRIPEMILWQ